METRNVRTFFEDGKQLALRQRGSVYDIVLDHVVLLSSAALETERIFGQVCRDVVPRIPKKVVIGGLGFGATVQGVLDVAEEDTRIVVVERFATVETLVRGELAHLTGGALDDPRVEVRRADVVDVIETERDVDVFLLDVDNGPNWASLRSNARLYAPGGLRAAYRALSDSGALCVWSGYPADAFMSQLRAVDFRPSVVPLYERGVVRARAYVGKK